MRIILTASGAALIALTAACEDPEPVVENTVEVPGPEAYQQELMGMTDAARNAVFMRAILDAGRECQHVESSSFVGEESTFAGEPQVEGSFPVWQAQCLGGDLYKIMIQNDGVATVVESAPGAAMQLGEGGGNQAAPAANTVAPVDAPANAQQPE